MESLPISSKISNFSSSQFLNEINVDTFNAIILRIANTKIWKFTINDNIFKQINTLKNIYHRYTSLNYTIKLMLNKVLNFPTFNDNIFLPISWYEVYYGVRMNNCSYWKVYLIYLLIWFERGLISLEIIQYIFTIFIEIDLIKQNYQLTNTWISVLTRKDIKKADCWLNEFIGIVLNKIIPNRLGNQASENISFWDLLSIPMEDAQCKMVTDFLVDVFKYKVSSRLWTGAIYSKCIEISNFTFIKASLNFIVEVLNKEKEWSKKESFYIKSGILVEDGNPLILDKFYDKRKKTKDKKKTKEWKEISILFSFSIDRKSIEMNQKKSWLLFKSSTNRSEFPILELFLNINNVLSLQIKSTVVTSITIEPDNDYLWSIVFMASKIFTEKVSLRVLTGSKTLEEKELKVPFPSFNSYDKISLVIGSTGFSGKLGKLFIFDKELEKNKIDSIFCLKEDYDCLDKLDNINYSVYKYMNKSHFHNKEYFEAWASLTQPTKKEKSIKNLLIIPKVTNSPFYKNINYISYSQTNKLHYKNKTNLMFMSINFTIYEFIDNHGIEYLTFLLLRLTAEENNEIINETLTQILNLVLFLFVNYDNIKWFNNTKDNNSNSWYAFFIQLINFFYINYSKIKCSMSLLAVIMQLIEYTNSKKEYGIRNSLINIVLDINFINTDELKNNRGKQRSIFLVLILSISKCFETMHLNLVKLSVLNKILSFDFLLDGETEEELCYKTLLCSFLTSLADDYKIIGETPWERCWNTFNEISSVQYDSTSVTIEQKKLEIENGDVEKRISRWLKYLIISRKALSEKAKYVYLEYIYTLLLPKVVTWSKNKEFFTYIKETMFYIENNNHCYYCNSIQCLCFLIIREDIDKKSNLEIYYYWNSISSLADDHSFISKPTYQFFKCIFIQWLPLVKQKDKLLFIKTNESSNLFKEICIDKSIENFNTFTSDFSDIIDYMEKIYEKNKDIEYIKNDIKEMINWICDFIIICTDKLENTTEYNFFNDVLNMKSILSYFLWLFTIDNVLCWEKLNLIINKSVRYILNGFYFDLWKEWTILSKTEKETQKDNNIRLDKVVLNFLSLQIETISSHNHLEKYTNKIKSWNKKEKNPKAETSDSILLINHIHLLKVIYTIVEEEQIIIEQPERIVKYLYYWASHNWTYATYEIQVNSEESTKSIIEMVFDIYISIYKNSNFNNKYKELIKDLIIPKNVKTGLNDNNDIKSIFDYIDRRGLSKEVINFSDIYAPIKEVGKWSEYSYCIFFLEKIMDSSIIWKSYDSGISINNFIFLGDICEIIFNDANKLIKDYKKKKHKILQCKPQRQKALKYTEILNYILWNYQSSITFQSYKLFYSNILSHQNESLPNTGKTNMRVSIKAFNSCNGLHKNQSMNDQVKMIDKKLRISDPKETLNKTNTYYESSEHGNKWKDFPSVSVTKNKRFHTQKRINKDKKSRNIRLLSLFPWYLSKHGKSCSAWFKRLVVDPPFDKDYDDKGKCSKVNKKSFDKKEDNKVFHFQNHQTIMETTSQFEVKSFLNIKRDDINPSLFYFTFFNNSHEEITKQLFNPKSLLKKIFPVTFKAITFKNERFIRLCKYYNSLFTDIKISMGDIDYSMQYPTKLKNFVCNDYYRPFLSPFSKFFLNENLKISHPYLKNIENKIEKNLKYLKIEKMQLNKIIPWSKEHKKFYCECINMKGAYFGMIYITKKIWVFIDTSMEDFRYKKEMSIQKKMQFVFSSDPSDSIKGENKRILIYLNEIEEIIPRRFCFQWVGYEIYWKNKRSYWFNFFNEENKSSFINEIIEYNRQNDWYPILIVNNLEETFQKKGFTVQYKEGKIDNFKYLNMINKYSARSFNDVNQYPVMPWIWIDFYTKKLRDFSKTVGQQRKGISDDIYIEYFESKGCHHSIHYSTSGYIMYYLVRLYPITDLWLKFQGGSFDNVNRMFRSLQDILIIFESTEDNREWIPEFYSDYNFMFNWNKLQWGYLEEKGQYLENVLPDGYKNIIDFIASQRLLLNNLEDVNLFIDNIFGGNQTNSNVCNIYSPESYESYHNYKKKIEEWRAENQTEERIYNNIKMTCAFTACGVTPVKLFKKLHPKQYSGQISPIPYVNLYGNPKENNTIYYYLQVIILKSNSANYSWIATESALIFKMTDSFFVFMHKDKEKEITITTSTFLNLLKQVQYEPISKSFSEVEPGWYAFARYNDNTIKIYNNNLVTSIQWHCFVGSITQMCPNKVLIGDYNGFITLLTVVQDMKENNKIIVDEVKSIQAHEGNIMYIQYNKRLKIIISFDEKSSITLCNAVSFEVLVHIFDKFSVNERIVDWYIDNLDLMYVICDEIEFDRNYVIRKKHKKLKPNNKVIYTLTFAGWVATKLNIDGSDFVGFDIGNQPGKVIIATSNCIELYCGFDFDKKETLLERKVSKIKYWKHINGLLVVNDSNHMDVIYDNTLRYHN